MVAAKDCQTCQQLSARNTSYLDRMALPQIEKNYSLSCAFVPNHTPDVAFQGNRASDLPGLDIGQQLSVGGFRKLLPPFLNSSNQCVKDSQYGLSHGIGFKDKPFDAPQKRFLIFDQSGNHTRLFYSPSFSPPDRFFASKTPAIGNGLSKEVATRIDHQFLMKFEEKWDENHLSDEEGDMLEDTEEINALLYSDSDDDEYDDNDDDDDDEVTSTDKSLNDEQVASSDENSPKRQRLLDDKYKKSSLESGESTMRQSVPSSCKDDVGDVALNKRANKVKVRQALKILETIIPGSDTKDPLSLIDKAVTYLRSMKAEAKALGLSYP